MKVGADLDLVTAYFTIFAYDTLVDQILAAKRADAAVDTSRQEAEIDRHVYALYGLTPAEIALVEGTATKS